MLKRLRFLPLIALALTLWAAGPARAQFLILAQDDDTVTELTNGSILTLEAAGIGQTVESRLRIQYNGQANTVARVEEPDLNGSLTFAVSTSADLPLQLQPGQIMDFRVRFTPTGIGPFTARLNLNLSHSRISAPDLNFDILVVLNGQSADYTLSFDLPDGNETLLPDGGVLSFPDTEIDDSTTATMIVTNRGTAPGSLEAVTLDGGSAFSLTGLALLPETIPAGGNVRFDVVFTPTARSNFGGSMQVTFGSGGRSVILAGRALGALLGFESIVDSIISPLEGGQTLLWQDITDVGARTVRVTNGGDVTTDVTTIALSGSDFRLENTAFLPLSLSPGGTTEFLVIFDPTEVGTSSGQLKINEAMILLSGSVSGVPSATISLGSEVVDPADQLSVNLSLGQSYPVDLTGVLVLDFVSDVFSNDPSIQFSTGGRAAEFTVPANSTNAIFGTGSQTVQVQTGTVAGVIDISGLFEVADVGLDVTPSSPPQTTLTVLRDRPVLRSVALTSLSASSLTLQVTGFATSRSVQDIEFSFTPAPGASLEASTIVADVENSFNSYYQGGGSMAFGSQFTATVNLNVDGEVDAVDRISVNVGNAEGVSETLTVNVQ